MSFGIIARCPRTGRFGVGVASYSIAVGLYCADAARANTGISITLGSPNPGNNALALRLLAQGFTPAHVLRELIINDPAADWRQIGVIGCDGTAVMHTGEMARRFAGHQVCNGHVALGDMLVGEQVLSAIVRGFEADASADLEERLLMALEAGRDAGGQVGRGGRLPERSAAMMVQGAEAYSDWDLRVDAHDRAVDELRRVHTEYKPNAAYYVERARNPHIAIPAMEFADMLAAQRPKAMP
jgi:uncharacterized Ntn-hydrolase superfamily protein